MNIRELLIRIGVIGARDADREIDNLDDRVGELKNSLSGLSGIFGAAFGAFSLQAIIHAADEMQTLEFRVGQMSQTAGTAADAFDVVAQHATASRTSIEAYVEAYAGIGAATHDLVTEQSDLLNITDAVAQGLALAGANTQQTSSVMSQLTQAISVGKLQWEDLRVILENSDAFAVRLAKNLNMSLSEMIKATQGAGGGIGADKIIGALRNMNEEVTKTFNTMPMTVSQAVVIITNRFDMLVNKFNRASKGISFIAGYIVNAFTYLETGIDYVTNALGGAENAVKILGVALGAAGLVGSVWALNTALGALFSPIGLLIAGLTAAYLVGQDFYTWLKGGPSLIGDLIGPASEYTSEINDMKDGMKGAMDMAVGLLRALRDLGEFFNIGQDVAADLGERTGANKVAPAVKKFGSWLYEDLGRWATKANDATGGAFDVVGQFNSLVARTRQQNAENRDTYQRENSFRGAFSEQDLPLASASAGGSPTLNVTISNISVESNGEQTTPEAVRAAAGKGLTDAFNAPAGYGRTLGDSLSFAAGGS